MAVVVQGVLLGLVPKGRGGGVGSGPVNGHPLRPLLPLLPLLLLMLLMLMLMLRRKVS